MCLSGFTQQPVLPGDRGAYEGLPPLAHTYDVSGLIHTKCRPCRMMSFRLLNTRCLFVLGATQVNDLVRETLHTKSMMHNRPSGGITTDAGNMQDQETSSWAAFNQYVLLT